MLDWMAEVGGGMWEDPTAHYRGISFLNLPPPTSHLHSANPKELVSLETQSPLWVSKAVLQRSASIGLCFGAIEWLQVKQLEIPIRIPLRWCAVLRVRQLQLVPTPEDRVRVGFRTHRRPVDAIRWKTGAIGLHGDLEPGGVKGVDRF